MGASGYGLPETEGLARNVQDQGRVLWVPQQEQDAPRCIPTHTKYRWWFVIFFFQHKIQGTLRVAFPALVSFHVRLGYVGLTWRGMRTSGSVRISKQRYRRTEAKPSISPFHAKKIDAPPMLHRYYTFDNGSCA